MAYDEREAPPPPPNRTLVLALLAVLLISVVAVFNLGYFANAYAGLAAFLMIPAAIGGLISLLYDPAGRRFSLGCFLWPTIGLLVLTAIAYFVFGEGAVCIAMVLPLWIPAAIVGALVSRYNAKRGRRINNSARLNSIAWLSIPLLLITAETVAPPHWEIHHVTREAIIDAEREKVWPLLLNVPDIAGVEGTANFSQDVLGIPRPTDAELIVRSGKLVRVAHWEENVRFEEEISILKPGEALGWQFSFPDDSVQQHTDHHISPDGPLLKIETGRYDLVQLSNGKTLVRLTTQYRMRTRLGGYLVWWGERLLGDVQGNVLAIIKKRAEKSAGQG